MKKFITSGPGPTECRTSSGSKSFGIMIVFLKEFYERDILEISQQTSTKT